MSLEEKYNYIAQYLAGELNDQEILAFNEWLETDTANQQLLEEAVLVWKASTPMPNTLKSWRKVEAEITPKGNYSVWLKAAMILVLIGLGLWFLNQSPQPREQLMVFQTTETETREIILADSSLVVLAPASKLTIKYPWVNERNMDFEGSAYFKVQSNKEKPFKVKTSEGEIRVLGTAFFLNTKKEKDQSLVAVQEGKVRFTSSDKNHQVDIPFGYSLPNTQDNYMTLEAFDQQDSYWLDHQLIYANESIKVILADLENIFDVTIKVEHKRLLDCKFSGKFKENQLTEILEVIAFALDLNIKKIANDRITLIGTGC